MVSIESSYHGPFYLEPKRETRLVVFTAGQDCDLSQREEDPIDAGIQFLIDKSVRPNYFLSSRESDCRATAQRVRDGLGQGDPDFTKVADVMQLDSTPYFVTNSLIDRQKVHHGEVAGIENGLFPADTDYQMESYGSVFNRLTQSIMTMRDISSQYPDMSSRTFLTVVRPRLVNCLYLYSMGIMSANESSMNVLDPGSVLTWNIRQDGMIFSHGLSSVSSQVFFEHPKK